MIGRNRIMIKKGETAMENKRATLQPVEEDRCLVYFDGKLLHTHLAEPFPPVAKDMAEILADDLNFVYSIGEADYKYSLVYCVLSTFAYTTPGQTCVDPNCKLNPASHTIDVANMLVWDRCFRMAPDPHFGIIQRVANYPVTSFLEGDWFDLPVNHCYSIEEIRASEASPDFENAVRKFSTLASSLTRAQRFATILVSNMWRDFSISMTLLLIAKLVTPEDYFKAVLVFRYEDFRERLTKAQKEESRRFAQKIQNLLKALDSNGIQQLI